MISTAAGKEKDLYGKNNSWRLSHGWVVFHLNPCKFWNFEIVVKYSPLTFTCWFKLSVVIKRIIIVIIKVLHYIFIYSSLECQAISFEDVLIGHITQHAEMERGHDFCGYLERRDNYSQSSPCDLSRKWPALLATTLVKPQLNCDINFVMKSSCRQPVP